MDTPEPVPSRKLSATWRSGVSAPARPIMSWLVFAAACLLSGCGGGGGGDPIIRESTFLPQYHFRLLHDADAPGPLEVTTPWGPDTRIFLVQLTTAGGVEGDYDSNSGVSSIASRSAMQVDTTDAIPDVGNISIEVTADIFPAGSGEFASGAWTVRYGTDMVTVSVVSNPSPGVELGLNGGPAEFIAWPAFTQLFAPGSATPEWQQAASASFQFLQLLLPQARLAFQALRDSTDAAFTTTPLVRDCGLFPVAPPDGVLLQGERVMAWLGSANQGFDLVLTDCWDDTAAGGPDYLYRGGVDLRGWSASNDFDNRLTFIGFGIDFFERQSGGVTYRDLRLDRTVVDGSGAHRLDDSLSMTLAGNVAGGFAPP
jgi:hypothetical protein